MVPPILNPPSALALHICLTRLAYDGFQFIFASVSLRLALVLFRALPQRSDERLPSRRLVCVV